jgi:5-methylcytosine-specific restriction endonuclease McrA
MRGGKDASRARRRRRALNELQGGRCYLCGQRFGQKPRSWPTMDHVEPKSQGGGWSGNVLLAHARCNQAKGDRRPRACEVLYLAAINERLKKA